MLTNLRIHSCQDYNAVMSEKLLIEMLRRNGYQTGIGESNAVCWRSSREQAMVVHPTRVPSATVQSGMHTEYPSF